MIFGWCLVIRFDLIDGIIRSRTLAGWLGDVWVTCGEYAACVLVESVLGRGCILVRIIGTAYRARTYPISPILSHIL